MKSFVTHESPEISSHCELLGPFVLCNSVIWFSKGVPGSLKLYIIFISSFLGASLVIGWKVELLPCKRCVAG
jgi:hypothetical protein